MVFKLFAQNAIKCAVNTPTSLKIVLILQMGMSEIDSYLDAAEGLSRHVLQ